MTTGKHGSIFGKVLIIPFVSDFLQQAEQRQWPPLIIGFGDEFTNRALHVHLPIEQISCSLFSYLLNSSIIARFKLPVQIMPYICLT